jgi:hypothetical protein
VQASQERSVVRSNISDMGDINNRTVELDKGAKRNGAEGHPSTLGRTTFTRKIQLILKIICL